MANQRSDRLMTGVVAVSLAAFLTGCSGTTYGTGVTQEQQLVNDVSSLVSFGQGKKKEKINYDSRPSLVKVSKVDNLPTPAEKIGSESGYFPEDPEVKRAKLLADAEGRDPSELSPEVASLRQESLERGKARGNSANDSFKSAEEVEGSPGDFRQIQERGKEVAAVRATERQAAKGLKRRYLTEPPVEYRRPANTAPVGTTGAVEKEPGTDIAANGKKKKSIFKSIFGK